MRERLATRTVDGVTYEIQLLPTGLGRPLLLKITQELAPILGAVAKGATEGVSATALAGEALSHLGSLSEATIAECERVFAEHSFVVEADGRKPKVSSVFSDHFAGRYDLLARWIFACCEVNFGSFFGAALRASGIASPSANGPRGGEARA